MSEIARQLEVAGIPVLVGRPGIGRTSRILSVTHKITGTGKEREGASDINSIVARERAVAYIERTGRVWLLADGPVGTDPDAIVFVAAYRESDITDEQHDSFATLSAILTAHYGIGAPDEPEVAGNGESEPDPGESDPIEGDES